MDIGLKWTGESPATARTVLVLLHAFPVDSRMWRGVDPARLPGVAVAAADMPGFGGCAPPEPGADSSLRVWAAALLRALDAAGAGRVVLAGCSMGGYLALEAWRSWPDRVAALVLCDTRSEPDTPEARTVRHAQVERVHAEGTAFLADAAADALLGPTTRVSDPALAGELREWVCSMRPEAIAGALNALASRPDSAPTLAAITVPTLCVVGGEDGVTPPDGMRRMAAAIPGADFHVIPCAGHLAPLEQPEAFTSLLARFLAGLE